MSIRGSWPDESPPAIPAIPEKLTTTANGHGPTNEGQAARRRYTGIATQRVQLGGDYDEWADIATSVTTGDVIDAQVDRDGQGNMRLGVRVLAGLIRAWSLEAPDGSPLPITYETLAALPFDMIAPAMEFVSGRINFLARTTPAT